MRGEAFLGIVENDDDKPADWDAGLPCVIWSSEYVLTSAGVYKCNGDAFVRVEKRPEGVSVEHLKAAVGQTIQDIRHDEEHNVLILLESGDAVTIERSILVDYSRPIFGPGYGYYEAGDAVSGLLEQYPTVMAVRDEQ